MQYRGAWLRCPHWCCCYHHVLRTCSVPMPGNSCWPWLLGPHIFPGTIAVCSKASGCESTVKSLQRYLRGEKPFTPHSLPYKLTRLCYYNVFIHRTWSSPEDKKADHLTVPFRIFSKLHLNEYQSSQLPIGSFQLLLTLPGLPYNLSFLNPCPLIVSYRTINLTQF